MRTTGPFQHVPCVNGAGLVWRVVMLLVEDGTASSSWSAPEKGLTRLLSTRRPRTHAHGAYDPLSAWSVVTREATARLLRRRVRT